jgi:dTMP kinase
MNGIRRGLFIVMEGCDRSGKTTHCQRLVRELSQSSATGAMAMRFPDRTTYIGKILDEYLRGEVQVDDHAVHLLFSSNRWEKVAEIYAALMVGTHVVVDRYAYSGVAFSAAKDGLSIGWCKQPDQGLPKPDLVCFLDVSPEVAHQRSGFGQELYERVNFQAKVRKNYALVADDTWQTVTTDKKSLEVVYQEIFDVVMKAIENHDDAAPIGLLW